MTTLVSSGYDSAVMRWAGFGPYYAMFPFSFAAKTVAQYSNAGDVVLDPFSGRGTTLFAAATQKRSAIGIEINPVGHLYTNVKLRPASAKSLIPRIHWLCANAWRYRKASERMPEFFQYCYSAEVREFLLIARNWLDWKCNSVDRTLMGLILVHLHGKRSDSLSNQMRQAKALSPPYALRWWRDRRMLPPAIDVEMFLRKKISWRYAKGLPLTKKCFVVLGDSEDEVSKLSPLLSRLGRKSAKLLLTSPPYCGVTNYHYDQWLRLWMLGGPDKPIPAIGANRGKFVDHDKYLKLLLNVFTASAEQLHRDAVVYVRTDSREITLAATLSALRVAFPKKTMRRHSRPFVRPTQTELFGMKGGGGEVDIVLT